MFEAALLIHNTHRQCDWHTPLFAGGGSRMIPGAVLSENFADIRGVLWWRCTAATKHCRQGEYNNFFQMFMRCLNFFHHDDSNSLNGRKPSFCFSLVPPFYGCLLTAVFLSLKRWTPGLNRLFTGGYFCKILFNIVVKTQAVVLLNLLLISN